MPSTLEVPGQETGSIDVKKLRNCSIRSPASNPPEPLGHQSWGGHAMCRPDRRAQCAPAAAQPGGSDPGRTDGEPSGFREVGSAEAFRCSGVRSLVKKQQHPGILPRFVNMDHLQVCRRFSSFFPSRFLGIVPFPRKKNRSRESRVIFTNPKP